MKKLTLMMTAVFVMSASYADTLEKVKANGKIICGVTPGKAGFSAPDEKNVWRGLDVAFCRAVAAAIFDDPMKVEFRPLSSKERFTALQSGEVDILSRTATKTMSRDTNLGLSFIGTWYYDGQGFLIKKDLGVTDINDLGGATVCLGAGTTSELNVTDYFKSHNIKYTPIVFEKEDEGYGAYDNGRCDVYSNDVSGLEAHRLNLKDPDANIILNTIISKEPLTPAVRQGDEQWFDLVSWTRNCLINAEELGVNSKNVEEMKKSDNPSIKRLLGVDGEFGKSIKLSEKWCASAIAKVGNYGEIYNRNLGKSAPITIERGLNNLWNNGGILYAAPIR